VLRSTTMPAIIVETHNAKNAAEARRWEEPAVRTAFARALATALAER
jgi:N-acetylmuramoyl-L-alanine amidase